MKGLALLVFFAVLVGYSSATSYLAHPQCSYASDCGHRCPFGTQVDRNGCPLRNCPCKFNLRPTSCPVYRCYTVCTYGCQIDKYGCQTCTCNQPPVQWSAWGSWSHCSATCGEGVSRRTRHCSSSSVLDRSCSGRDSETRSCRIAHCPEPPRWSSWSSWTSCSMTCGIGEMRRTRHCLSSSGHDRNCPGRDIERRRCRDRLCPEPCPVIVCQQPCVYGCELDANGCQTCTCKKPNPKPGQCPVLKSCSSDYDCEGDMKCCRVEDRYNICTPSTDYRRHYA